MKNVCDKNEKIKPVVVDGEHGDEYYCPKCGCAFELLSIRFRFCQYCGTAADWSFLKEGE